MKFRSEMTYKVRFVANIKPIRPATEKEKKIRIKN